MKNRTMIMTMILVLAFSASLFAQGVNDIFISGVTNTWPLPGDYTMDTQLRAGYTHQITITFDATGGAGYVWLGTNAFELYSPDGADWGYLQATRGDYIWNLPLKYSVESGKCSALESFLKHGYKAAGTGTFITTVEGPNITKCFCFVEPCNVPDPYTTVATGGNTGGSDTVGFFHAAVGTGVGFVGGSMGEALFAEFTTVAADNGKTICFDTNGVFQAWEWAAAGYPLNNGSDFPNWDNGQGVDGPICWEIYDEASDVSVSGLGNLPTTYALNQNYPNPFNPSTIISFDIPERANVELTVYNVLGQRVVTLVNQEMAPDSYEVVWDGESDGGNKVASGIYFYRLTTENKVMTKKMMMLK